MGLFSDIGDFVSDAVDVVGDAANIVGDVIGGAGDVIGAAGDLIGGLGGMLGDALSGIGGMLGSIGGVLGDFFPPLGIAASLGGMLLEGLGGAVKAGTQLLQQVAQVPKFAANEFNDLVHTATAQLTGGGQTDPACDAAVKDKWGGQVQDFWSQVTQGFVSNCTEASGGDKKEDWIDILLKGLKGAIGDAFQKMSDSSNAISGGASQDPAALVQFQKDAQFFNLVMTTATQTIKESLDAAKNTAQAA